jgi:hypothetical protein
MALAKESHGTEPSRNYMGNRDEELKRYGHLYKVLTVKDGPFTCFYCGDNACTYDHCPPISRVDDYRAYRLMIELYLKIPSCKECNSLLSNKLQETLEHRIDLLKDLLSRRYRNMFKGGMWSKSRIDEEEIKGQLAKYLTRISRDQKKLIERLNFNEGIRSYRNFLLEVY